MWTRQSWFLAVKVRLGGVKPRLRLGVWLALFVPYQWALSLEGATALLPKSVKGRVNIVLEVVQECLLLLMHSGPQTYVHADVQEGEKRIWVEVKTLGRKRAQAG